MSASFGPLSVCVGILDAYVCVWGDKGVNSLIEAHQSMEKITGNPSRSSKRLTFKGPMCTFKGTFWHEME